MQTPRYTPDEVKHFPAKPGVYRFFNEEETIIYVGKAKSLKSRVSSYFAEKGHSRKTARMVSEIKFIEFTIVNTEFDALLLENSLIKENQPKYNILLKDDKTFPYVVVVDEPFPRIYSTRTVQNNYGQYFGPYASVKAMKSVLELIRNLYHIRTCNLNLSEKQLAKNNYKVCLEYHIGKCLGPCEHLQTEKNYLEDIKRAKDILKGNLAPVKRYFTEEMNASAESLQFEKAQEMKEKLELLDKFQSRSVVVNQSISDVDAFALVADEKRAFINYIRITNGAVTLNQSVEVKKKLSESDSELLAQIIVHLRTQNTSHAREILTNIPLDVELDVPHRVPVQGDKRKLVDLALKNALFYKKEKTIREDPDYYREKRVLETLQNDLQLKDLPEHIECFDNSNLQGSNPVASMVCFRKGKPYKKDYRHFNIKTVVGPNDFASMKEIVGRRYKRLLDENQKLPDLVIVDGGKGQLSSAVEALQELSIYGQIPIIGIAKRLEEIYYPDDQYPLYISKKSESLKLIQQLRDEAHRFAITFHRQKRSKAAINSSLEKVDGIGKKTAEKLLRHFKSVKKIREAEIADIALLIGKSKAKTLLDSLKKEAG